MVRSNNNIVIYYIRCLAQQVPMQLIGINKNRVQLLKMMLFSFIFVIIIYEILIL